MNQRAPSEQDQFRVHAREEPRLVAAGGLLLLYRANVNLFMTPSVWRGNAMKTPAGDSFLRVSAPWATTSAVGVTLLARRHGERPICLVGIANTDSTETVPEGFHHLRRLRRVVHQNQACAFRNLNVISTAKTSFRTARRPEESGRDAAPRRGSTSPPPNVPIRNTIGMQCEPAKLNANMVTSTDPGSSRPQCRPCPRTSTGSCACGLRCLRRSPRGRTMRASI